MKKFAFLTILLSTLLFVSCINNEPEDYTKFVNPYIGTAHCRWFHFAPGALPFGLAKPGAATNAHLGNKSGWEATGYDYRDITIEGFPCLHEFQVGGIVLMPANGELKTIPGPVNDTTGIGYRSRFDRKDEIATAGYYSVLLKDYNIKAELTATQRVAFQRFTFPKGENRILFDIGNRQGESGEVLDSRVEYREDGSVEGFVITAPEYVKKYQPGANVKMYFYAVLDSPADNWGAFNGCDVRPGDRIAVGKGAGLYLNFDTAENQQITVKVGLSYTSVDNARANLLSEAENKSFNQVREASHQIWNEHLGRIAVESDNYDDKVKFYTGLYHAILGRGMASDVNGAYPKHDGSVGHIPVKDGLPEYNLYNTDAFWGAQWNINQLWILAYPEYVSDMISSHLRVYQDSGWLGDGLANSCYVSGVGTNQLTLLIAAAYQCGIRDFDLDLAYEACLKNEIDGKDRPFGAGRVDTDYFVKYGYVPHLENMGGYDETFMFSASHTLEYSFSCYALAQWAGELQKTNDYEKLMWLSDGWKRIYDPSTNFVRPRLANGDFISKFNPMQVWRGFQEGNAWQYTFYVPHDIKTLASMVGEDTFNNRLDSIFTESQKLIFSGGRNIGAFAGLETLYNQGNQPCLHESWLFNETQRPYLTQKWVRAILDEFYGTDGIHGYGYGQDEDQGQLGAWYSLSSLGLFDVKGLTDAEPSFSVGSPVFDKIVISLNSKYYSGDAFVIETENNSKSNIFIQSVLFDEKPLNSLRIPFKDVSKGGILKMVMGSDPIKKY